jgi:hypothetical protein
MGLFDELREKEHKKDALGLATGPPAGEGQEKTQGENGVVPATQEAEKKAAPDWKGPIGHRYLGGRPRKFKTPEEFLVKVAEYLEACCDDKGNLVRPVTISGMCNFIGTYRQRLLEYENGSLEGLKDGNGDDEGFRVAIKRAKSICEEFAEDHMFTARNPAGAIFALKNYGWKDTQTIETTTTEIHTIDPETREILGGYMRQLVAAQKCQVIDITPTRLPEPVKVQSGGESQPPLKSEGEKQ